jgi:hypothetical membrane protein
MTQTITRAGAVTCDPATRITRSLLGYGVIAGPIYVAVSVTEALTRDGFDLRRHAWSLLANGHLGWIHVTNLVLTGLMTIAFAVGLRRASDKRWASRLLAVYGLSLVAAGVFRADPAQGFPAGTPEKATWHGALHFVSGGIGFACLVVACFVIGGLFARVTGVVFLAGFGAVVAGGGAVWANLAFTAAVILAWAWVSTLAIHLYRWPAAPVQN